jgi:cell division protein FtsQ
MPRLKRSPRNSVHDRPGRLKLLWRRCRRHGKFLLALGAALAVFLLVLATGHPGGTLAGLRERLGGMAAQTGLRVQQVVIVGRANTPEPLLRAAIGISRGDSILAVSLHDVRARIESLSWVASATVERRLPDRIMVQLVERRPFAIWQHQGKFRVIDRAGQVMEQELVDARDLPLVVGTGAPVAAAALLDALSEYPALLARLVAAVRVGERRWNLRLNNGADILLPESAEGAAIARLMTLQQDQGLLDRPLKTVDMRLPDRLIVRPQVETNPGGVPNTPNAPQNVPAPNVPGGTTPRRPT